MNRTNILIVCLNVIIYFPVLYGKRELPSFVKVCKRTDPELSACIKSSILALQPYLGKGVPEMKIPPLDPLSISELDIDTGSIDFKFKNLEFGLVDHFDLKKVEADYGDNCSSTIEVSHPIMVVNGLYTAKGRILLFELAGEGSIALNATNIHMSASMKCAREMRKGKQYLKFNDIEYDIGIEGMTFYFQGLFKNNPELTDTVNAALNENKKSLAKDFEPVIGKAIKEIVVNIVQGVFDAYPFDVLVPK